MLDKSLQIMTQNTAEVVNEPTWEDVDHSTLRTMLAKEALAAPEIVLFEAIDR